MVNFNNYIVLLILLFSVDFSSITINHSNEDPVIIIGEAFYLSCAIRVTPFPLPQGVIAPSLEWFFGPSNSPLPSGVTETSVTGSANTLNSTLHIAQLQHFHAGMYTCRVRGSERLAATSRIITLSGENIIIMLPYLVTYQWIYIIISYQWKCSNCWNELHPLVQYHWN